jgi:transposase-like protein
MTAGSSQLRARPGSRWVSLALIAGGIVGLVVAVSGIAATAWANGRIGELRSEAQLTVTRVANTMEIAASVLLGASSTAQSFSGTAGQAAEAVSAAVLTTAEVQSDLSALEAQLRSVNIFGATPLSSSADAVGRIVTSMEGLDAELSLVAEGLEGNADALAGNASSLSELANSTRALAKRLGPSAGVDAFAEVQQVMAMTLLMLSAWSIVPAAGALALGLWLRRGLDRPPPA